MVTKRAITSRNSDQVTIRLPEGMREELNRIALENGRSANLEIAYRLKKSLNPTESPEYIAIREYLGEEIDSMKARLDRLSTELTKVTEAILNKK